MGRSHLARSLHQHRNQPEAKFLQMATAGLDQSTQAHSRISVICQKWRSHSNSLTGLS
ncbi:MAG: hypothetical protein ACKPCM_06780 [Pseudanabaena sp.]